MQRVVRRLSQHDVGILARKLDVITQIRQVDAVPHAPGEVAPAGRLHPLDVAEHGRLSVCFGPDGAIEIAPRAEGYPGVLAQLLVPVAEASHAPIKLIGVGEGVQDLQPFDARSFARSLVGLEAD